MSMKGSSGMKSKMGLIIPSMIAVVAFVFLSVVFINNSNTRTIVVPTRTIQAGEMITDADLKEIQVSSNIQGISSKAEIVGLKTPKTLNPDMVLYMSNFQSNIFSSNIPANFIVTTINIPRDQAVGGAIAAGDFVDISGVSNCQVIHSFSEDSVDAREGKQIDNPIDRRLNETQCVYYILSNVEVLQVSDVVNNESSSGSLGNSISSDTAKISLAVALSYEDTKKIRQAEGVLNIWANLSPQQNSEHPPLLDEMYGQSYSGLHDATDTGKDIDGKFLKSRSGTTNSDKLPTHQNNGPTNPVSPSDGPTPAPSNEPSPAPSN